MDYSLMGDYEETRPIVKTGEWAKVYSRSMSSGYFAQYVGFGYAGPDGIDMTHVFKDKEGNLIYDSAVWWLEPAYCETPYCEFRMGHPSSHSFEEQELND